MKTLREFRGGWETDSRGSKMEKTASRTVIVPVAQLNAEQRALIEPLVRAMRSDGIAVTAVVLSSELARRLG